MNLQNLIDYAKIEGYDLLDGVNVPPPLNAETVKSAIMIRCGLLTPVFSEPALMREYIKHFFITKQWTINHLIKIIQAEYSPIENYDRMEDWTDTHDGTRNEDRSGKDTSLRDTENTVSAYNSGSYQPDSKTEEEENNNFTNTAAEKTKDKNIRTGRAHGNIGVTTNQQMINEELELLRHFDIYSYIAKLFEEELMLLIY